MFVLHVVHENLIGCIIWVFIRDFPHVIADSERDMQGIEPWALGWYTSALTTGLQEVRFVLHKCSPQAIK
jgi:hypothetical protein